MTIIKNDKSTNSQHLSIIILNWNGWKDTLECLESVFQTNYKNYSVVLVDNGSSDNSLQQFRDYCRGDIKVNSPFVLFKPENKPIPFVELNEDQLEKSAMRSLQGTNNKSLLLIKCKKNHGYAKGNNIGIRAALKFYSPKYILILNNDIIVNDATMFSSLIACANQDNSIGLVSPILSSCTGEIQGDCVRTFPLWRDYFFIYSFLGQKIFRHKRLREKYVNLSYISDKALQVDVSGGSCLMFKSESLTRIGLFDENTFLYWEEFIIGKKLRSHGIKSCILPTTSVLHKGEMTINNLDLKSWARFWSIQSEIYYINTYAPLTRMKRFLLIIILLIEAMFGWGMSIFSKGKNKFDGHYERKIIKFLLKSI